MASRVPDQSTGRLPVDPTESAPEIPLVTAIVVVHDGAGVVEECLDALSEQTIRPQRVVAVDTGSIDGSVEILERRLGDRAVVRRSRDTTFGAAVEAGKAAFAGAPAPAGGTTDPIEWLWLLHDDCAPDPTALSCLLARAQDSPSVWAVGPKVRDWSGQRLLEVGVTIDRIGHRETGLEGRELDQGQADDRNEALAAGTAGLLVRRDAWDRLGGIDDVGWPLADDVDFGWRITAAGGRVGLAPDATVRHLAAMTNGRRSPDSPVRLGASARQSGMQVVLANVPSATAWLLWLRMVFGSIVRALGLLVVLRRPAAARDELAAAAAVVASTWRLARLRRIRRQTRAIPHREIRRSLAGVDDRLRHLFDALRGAVPVPRRTAAARSTGETGPVDDAGQSLDSDDAAALRRFVSRPGVALFLVASVLSLIADRGLFSETLSGGRLLPAPMGSSDMWHAFFQAWHPIGAGTSAMAPPALALLAVFSTVLFGKPGLAVDVLILGAIPLSAMTAWHGLKVLTRSVPLRLWGAVAWATLPAVTGAVADGRIDACAAAILLPLLARSMTTALTRLDGSTGQPGAWTRCFGTGLLLGLVTAFAPIEWILAVIAAAMILLLSARTRPRAWRSAAGLAIIAVVGFAVCEPWSFAVLAHPSEAVIGLGLPDQSSPKPLSAGHLLLLHPGGGNASALWVCGALLLAALAALGRGGRTTWSAWVVVAIGLGAALVLSRLHGVSDGVPDSRVWSGMALLTAGGGAIASAVSAAEGAQHAIARRAFGVVQPTVVAVSILAVAAVAWGALGWLIRGAGGPLRSSTPAVAPIFVADALSGVTSPRAVLLSGRSPVRAAVIRAPDGLDLATGAVAANLRGSNTAAADAALRTAIADLIAGRATAPAELAAVDVQYVVADHRTAPELRRGAAAIGGFAVTPSSRSLVLKAPLPASEAWISADPQTAGQASMPLKAADDGTIHTSLSGSPTPRTVTLAEPASRHWHATLAGHTLAASPDGWHQSFVIPANASGALSVDYQQPGRGILLALELAVVIVCGLLSLPLWRFDAGPGS